MFIQNYPFMSCENYLGAPHSLRLSLLPATELVCINDIFCDLSKVHCLFVGTIISSAVFEIVVAIFSVRKNTNSFCLSESYNQRLGYSFSVFLQ